MCVCGGVDGCIGEAWVEYLQVTKKFSERKQTHVGMEPSKTNDTTILSHHPYISSKEGCGRQWGG